MRKIFCVLKLILILFLTNIVLSFYTIFIGDVYGNLDFNLGFIEYLQVGNHADAAARSLNLTILFSIFLFVLSTGVSLVLIYWYFKGVDKRIFNLLRKKNRILFEFGMFAINPYFFKHKVIDGRGKASKIFIFIFYIFLAWIIFLFLFEFEVVKTPEVLRTLKLVINHKIYLFIFNVMLFYTISFGWFTCLFGAVLTLISILKKQEL
ncbi:hypothetical protein [Neisseria dumasiana]|uniref:DUF4328 domain-containing protein n=1 Tax=Neisseria dumasiana TaxID=1931275 RepID=A0ABX3WLZ5_9NEIS|nr:hypothetical protein [Neisseria dumasiana]OSI34164.1 hypothetical protein BV913_07565 [Neisseria dumasiana]UOO84539.1 hypothetical protein LVJ88_00500 [Neisseria dumasiana]